MNYILARSGESAGAATVRHYLEEKALMDEPPLVGALERELIHLQADLVLQKSYYEALANDQCRQINELIRERDEARAQLKRGEVDEFDLEVDG